MYLQESRGDGRERNGGGRDGERKGWGEEEMGRGREEEREVGVKGRRKKRGDN